LPNARREKNGANYSLPQGQIAPAQRQAMSVGGNANYHLWTEPESNRVSIIPPLALIEGMQEG